MNDKTNAIAQLVARINALPDGSDDKERIKLLSSLYDEQQRLNSALLTILLAGDSPVKRRAAAYLLGLYGLDHSVEHMMQHIALKRPAVQDYWMGFGGEYPVRTALIDIGVRGDRVIRFTIEKLETSEDQEARRLSAEVLRMIFPSYPDIPRIIVEKAVAKQPDPEKKERLQAGLKYFPAPESR